MGFFGDIGKGFAGAIRGGAQLLRSPAAQTLVPLAAGAFGGPGAAATAAGLVGAFQPRRPAGPLRTVRRTSPALGARAVSRVRPRVPPIVTRGPIVPRAMPARAAPVTRRRAPIAARPAALQFRVPPELKRRAGQVTGMLPFTFGDGRTAGRGSTFGEITPISEAVDKFGRPLVVEAKTMERMRCPPGYLAIELPDGSQACALAGPAIAAGLAKRRRKPLISVKETNALRLAGRAQRKIDNVHKKFGSKPRRRPMRRSSGKTS